MRASKRSETAPARRQLSTLPKGPALNFTKGPAEDLIVKGRGEVPPDQVNYEWGFDYQRAKERTDTIARRFGRI